MCPVPLIIISRAWPRGLTCQRDSEALYTWDEEHDDVRTVKTLIKQLHVPCNLLLLILLAPPCVAAASHLPLFDHFITHCLLISSFMKNNVGKSAVDNDIKETK